MKRALLFLALVACGAQAAPAKNAAMPDRSTTACVGDPVPKESGPRTDLAADLEGLPITRIEVAGNRLIHPNLIVAATRLEVGVPLSHDAVAKAIRRIYESGELDDVEVFVQHDGAGVGLTIMVRERPRIAEIFAPGIPDATKTDMAKWLGIEHGRPFDLAHVYEQRRTISEGMAHRGARFDIRTHMRAGNEVDVCIVIQQ